MVADESSGRNVDALLKTPARTTIGNDLNERRFYAAGEQCIWERALNHSQENPENLTHFFPTKKS